MALTDRQRDLLTPGGQTALDMLAGLREGRTINEVAERLEQVVNAVIEHVVIDDKGKVSGPKGKVTLVLEVAPNEWNHDGTVNVSEKVTSAYPEDRSHVMYVGRGGTLHTHTPPGTGLFAIHTTTDGKAEAVIHEPETPADTLSAPDAVGNGTTPDTRMPYKDD